MKRQIIFIHGGETFDTYEEYVEYLKNYAIDFSRTKEKRWRDTLETELGVEVIAPSMPSPKNAKYAEWKIWFEKYLPILEEGVVLIGHSLGGIFLAKYLAENALPKKAAAVFLVAAPYSDEGDYVPYSLADFVLPPSLAPMTRQASRIILVHSEDDMVVPYGDLARYKKALPEAEVMTFTDRGHFLQESFPELVHKISLL